MARGVGVGAGLDGAPVVAGGERHGVDAVHDALVVGGGAVRVDVGEVGGDDDAVAHALAGEALARERGGRQRDLGARQRAVGEVGEDAQEDLALGDGLDQRGHAFAHAVDQVGAHGVAGVDEQVHDEHLAVHAWSSGSCGPRRPRRRRRARPCAGGSCWRGRGFPAARSSTALMARGMSGHLDHLDLADQDGRRRGGREAARSSGRPSPRR